MTYRKGHRIIREGEQSEGMYCIQKGKVKIVASGINNSEHILQLKDSKNNVLGFGGLTSASYFSTICLEETTVCFFEKDVLKETLLSDVNFTIALMTYYINELKSIGFRKKNLAQMQVRERVMEALLFIADSFGLLEDQKTLPIKLSRQDLAAIAGTNAEQISRFMSEFKRDKLISIQSNQIKFLNESTMRKHLAAY